MSKNWFKTYWDLVTERMNLFPALIQKHAWEIEGALKKEVPEMLSAIKLVNNSINQILNLDNYKEFISDSFNVFILNAKNYYDSIVKWEEWNIWKENFVKYINLLFLFLRVRKLYNTSPRDSFSDFYDMELSERFLKLVIPKWIELPFLNTSTWWSCHNYSMVFKDFFDILWIDSKVIFCNPISNHSFVLANIFWKYYIIDPLFNKKWFIEEVNVWDTIKLWFISEWEIKELSSNLLKIIHHKEFSSEDKIEKLVIFDSIDDFKKILDNRIIKYIIFEYFSEKEQEIFRFELSNEFMDKLNIETFLWNLHFKYQIKIHKIKEFFKDKNIEELSNYDIILHIIKKVYKCKSIWKKPIISEEKTLEHIKLFADMIKREDLLELLKLKKFDKN